MQCIKMKRVVVAFLLANSFIFLSVVGIEEAKQGEFQISKETCPQHWENIKMSGIQKYATNCKNIVDGYAKLHELSIHQDICRLINSLLAIICQNIGSPQLVVEPNFSIVSIVNNTMSICPITSLNETGLRGFEELSRVLGDEKYCNRLCYDWREVEKQCVALVKVSDFFIKLKSQLRVHDEVVRTSKPSETTQTRVLNGKNLPHSQESVLLETLRGRNYYNTNNNKTDQSVFRNQNEMDENVTNSSRSGKTQEYQYRFSEVMEMKGKQNEETDMDSDTTKITKLKSSEVYPPVTNGSQTQEINTNIQDISQKQSEATDTAFQEPTSARNVKQKSVTVTNKSDDKNINIVTSEIDEKNKKDNPIEYGVDTEFSENHPPVKVDTFSLTNQNEIYSGEGFFQTEESHFFVYFIMFISIMIIGYLAFHNKNKILAYALEGRRDRRSRRRPNPAKYSKLESNLEEAIASNTTHSSACSIVY